MDEIKNLEELTKGVSDKLLDSISMLGINIRVGLVFVGLKSDL